MSAEPMFGQAGMEELWRNPRESRGSIWTHLKWWLSLTHLPLDVFHFSCHRAGMPGWPEGRDQNWLYVWKVFSPPVLPLRCLGLWYPDSAMFEFGPTKAVGAAIAMASHTKPGLWQFLGKINLLFILLCTHIPSWAIQICLPNPSVSHFLL